MKRKFLLLLLFLLFLPSCKEEIKPVVEEPEILSTLEVTFLDVGQADCALIECDGEYLLVDGGNVGDSNKVASHLQRKGIDFIDFVVGTHAHEDHIGGLSGALSVASAGTVFSPTDNYDSEAFRNFKKYAVKLTLPSLPYEFELGDAVVTFLSPLKEYEDTNNTSIVLKITHGENSFLFMGDAEYEAEIDIIESGADLSADVLKVGHHGSSTSSSYRLIREVMPEFAVISVGKDNTYSHPHEEVLSRFEDAESTVLRTDELGDIVFLSDGENLTFSTDKEVFTETKDFIGNKKSKVVHKDSCSSLPAEHNRIYFDSKEEALKLGYKECSNCK